MPDGLIEQKLVGNTFFNAFLILVVIGYLLQLSTAFIKWRV
jgi:hypothetical protein